MYQEEITLKVLLQLTLYNIHPKPIVDSIIEVQDANKSSFHILNLIENSHVTQHLSLYNQFSTINVTPPINNNAPIINPQNTFSSHTQYIKSTPWVCLLV